MNASSKGIVFLDIRPAEKGRSGPFEITVEHLGLGLEDPDAFVGELGAGTETPGPSMI